MSKITNSSSVELITDDNSNLNKFYDAIKNKQSFDVISSSSVYDNNELISKYSYLTNRIKDSRVMYWLRNDNLNLIASWRLWGKSLEDIANEIGIKIATLYEWRRDYPQFNYALSRTREIVGSEIESYAFKSAKGYTTTVIKPMVVKKAVKDDTGKVIGYEEFVEYVAEQEHIKPEIQMQQFLLKNILSDKYKTDAKAIAEAFNSENMQRILTINQQISDQLKEATGENIEPMAEVIKDDD